MAGISLMDMAVGMAGKHPPPPLTFAMGVRNNSISTYRGSIYTFAENALSSPSEIWHAQHRSSAYVPAIAYKNDELYAVWWPYGVHQSQSGLFRILAGNSLSSSLDAYVAQYSRSLGFGPDGRLYNCRYQSGQPRIYRFNTALTDASNLGQTYATMTGLTALGGYLLGMAYNGDIYAINPNDVDSTATGYGKRNTSTAPTMARGWGGLASDGTRLFAIGEKNDNQFNNYSDFYLHELSYTTNSQGHITVTSWTELGKIGTVNGYQAFLTVVPADFTLPSS